MLIKNKNGNDIISFPFVFYSATSSLTSSDI